MTAAANPEDTVSILMAGHQVTSSSTIKALGVHFQSNLKWDTEARLVLQQIAFTGIARVMMQMNSCANPFVYASTIPTFKQIAKDFFTCNLGKRTNE